MLAMIKRNWVLIQAFLISVVISVLAIVYLLPNTMLSYILYRLLIILFLITTIIEFVIAVASEQNARRRRALKRKHRKQHNKIPPTTSPAFLEFLNNLPAGALDIMYVIEPNGNEHKAEFVIEDGKIVDMN